MTIDQMESQNVKFSDDEIMNKIFITLVESPQSATQISDKSNVPISSVYRKLKKLEEKKLIETSGMIKNDRSRIKLYKKKSMLKVNPYSI